jgi:ribosome maturation factor RimP
MVVTVRRFASRLEVGLCPPFFFLIPAMSSNDPIRQRLITIVEPVCTAAGYDLVDLRLKSDQGGWVLRIFIDVALAPDAPDVPIDQIDPEWWKHGVDLADCETLSRELSAVLDVDDPIPQAYSLEVSSPGIDRPLRTDKHFTYFTGSEAKISLGVPMPTPTGERRNFKGVLRGVVDGKVRIECDGPNKPPFELPIADIDHARLVPDWDAVMHKHEKPNQPKRKHDRG